MSKRTIPAARFSQGLFPSDDSAKAVLVTAAGVVSRNDALYKKAGESSLATAPDSNRVTSLVVADFDSGSDLYRCQPNSLRRFDSGGPSWGTATTPHTTTAPGEQYVWRAATILNKCYLSQGIRFWNGAAYDNNGVLQIATLGAAPTVVTGSPGVRDILAFNGRLWGCWPHYSDGTFYPYRLVGTDALDPTDWYTGGLYTDLTSDSGFPLQRLLAQSGRMILFKGNSKGGNLLVGSPTGDALNPLSFEPIYGQGILGAGTLVTVRDDVSFFLSHDGYYAIRNGQLQPIANPLIEDLLANFDTSKDYRAWSGYDPRRGVISLAIPTGTGITRYHYNVRTQVWTGPSTTTATCMSYTQTTQSESWDTDTGTWDSDDGSWDSSTFSVGAPIVVLGRTDGLVVKEVETTASDYNSTAIAITIETADETFADQTFSLLGRRYPVAAQAADMKIVDALVLRYRDYGTFTPTISISINGGNTWHQVFSSAITGEGTHAYNTYRVTFPALTSDRFRVRITHSSATEQMVLVGFDWQAALAGPRVNV